MYLKSITMPLGCAEGLFLLNKFQGGEQNAK